MTTASDIVTQALKKAGVIGIGEAPGTEDMNDAFSDLQDMMYQWQRKRWLIYHLIDSSVVSTGAVSYTVGPGASFNVMRPDRIEAAFLRQVTQTNPNQIDYPLKIIEAREDYNRIAIKQLQSFPEWVFYDAAYPVGVLYPWPVPNPSIYEVHITVKEQLQSFANLATAVNLPPEYVAALKFNLAVRINAGYPGVQINPEVKAIATESLNVIRGANTQIAKLQMPKDLTRNGIYDVYSDRTY